MRQFSHTFMQANCGCYSNEQLMACSFMANDPVTLESIVNSEIRLKDKFWFVCRKVLSKEQNQQLAIDVAEIVLPIFEQRYPNDKRPREAVAAARMFIAGSISLEQLLERKRAAAYAYAAAAAAAAYAAAAYAAAYAAAAYAADAAAAADADAAAADADAAAAAAAAAAYAADAIKQQLLDYLINITTVHEAI